MIKFLDNEHLCGAAKCKKKVLKAIETGEITNPDLTPENVDEAFDAILPLMVYAGRRGVKLGAAAAVAGMVTGALFTKCAETFAPRIREAVMKKLGK